VGFTDVLAVSFLTAVLFVSFLKCSNSAYGKPYAASICCHNLLGSIDSANAS